MISLAFYRSEGGTSVRVEWTLDATATTIKNVSINHCRPDILVPEQFLDGPNVVSRSQQVSRERVTKCVRTDVLGDSSGDNRSMDGVAHC